MEAETQARMEKLVKELRCIPVGTQKRKDAIDEMYPLLVPPLGPYLPGERVKVWNKDTGNIVAGNAAPRLGALKNFLLARITPEVFVNQNEVIRPRKRKKPDGSGVYVTLMPKSGTGGYLSGASAPMWENTKTYLVENPGYEIRLKWAEKEENLGTLLLIFEKNTASFEDRLCPLNQWLEKYPAMRNKIQLALQQKANQGTEQITGDRSYAASSIDNCPLQTPRGDGENVQNDLLDPKENAATIAFLESLGGVSPERHNSDVGLTTEVCQNSEEAQNMDAGMDRSEEEGSAFPRLTLADNTSEFGMAPNRVMEPKENMDENRRTTSDPSKSNPSDDTGAGRSETPENPSAHTSTGSVAQGRAERMRLLICVDSDCVLLSAHETPTPTSMSSFTKLAAHADTTLCYITFRETLPGADELEAQLPTAQYTIRTSISVEGEMQFCKLSAGNGSEISQHDNVLDAIRALQDIEDAVDECTMYVGDDFCCLASSIPSVVACPAVPTLRYMVQNQSKLSGTKNALFFACGAFEHLGENYLAAVLEGITHFYFEFTTLVGGLEKAILAGPVDPAVAFDVVPNDSLPNEEQQNKPQSHLDESLSYLANSLLAKEEAPNLHDDTVCAMDVDEVPESPA